MEEIMKLVQICLSSCLPKDTIVSRGAAYILDQALKSAAFWELPRLRGATSTLSIEATKYSYYFQLRSINWRQTTKCMVMTKPDFLNSSLSCYEHPPSIFLAKVEYYLLRRLSLSTKRSLHLFLYRTPARSLPTVSIARPDTICFNSSSSK